jgi:hypothetical protein
MLPLLYCLLCAQVEPVTVALQIARMAEQYAAVRVSLTTTTDSSSSDSSTSNTAAESKALEAAQQTLAGVVPRLYQVSLQSDFPPCTELSQLSFLHH